MDDHERADDELVAALRERPEVMGVLYERHAAAIYRYLARRVGRLAADDLLGDVFVAALTARKRVTGHDSGSALPWLYGIARNVLRAHSRQSAQGERVLHDLGMDWAAVDVRLDAQAQRVQLRAALAGLSEDERDVLLLVAWEGLTPTEAAVALEISPVAARSRLHRGRLQAQRSLARTTSVRSAPASSDPRHPKEETRS